MTEYPHAAALDEIVRMSRWTGDPDKNLAILAEGNTSIKVGARLLVKASGAGLAASEATDFVEVDREVLGSMIEAGTATDADVAATMRAATTWGEKRPSVETLLHVVCQEYETVSAVIHCHPVSVNALLCSRAAHVLVEGSYFPDQIVTLGRNPLLMEYIDPGLRLAHAARQRILGHVESTGSPPKVIYLQNHGLFALGGTVAEAQQIVSMADKLARILIGALAAGGAVPLAEAEQQRIDTRPDELLRRRMLLGDGG